MIKIAESFPFLSKSYYKPLLEKTKNLYKNKKLMDYGVFLKYKEKLENEFNLMQEKKNEKPINLS